ncbi:YolD-like family protein [Halalkalibacterium halodurans]|uniref:YolD-like protein n=1 Tax=Halalkalibacterium halodurans TaxID=86665 RepID=A0A0M0KMM8_ALKHA|nr:YolD-like family protein [Halalkalibacterium halodurans]TPE70693.1 YolD-like family protein [Halalkalibacterium halodurans]
MKQNKLTPGTNLRWESSRFMLPEHISALQQYKFESKKVSKPTLDEQELQEIGYLIMDSIDQQYPLSITYWHEGFYQTVVGHISKIDQQLKQIKVVLDDDDIYYVKIDCLKSASKI